MSGLGLADTNLYNQYIKFSPVYLETILKNVAIPDLNLIQDLHTQNIL